MARDFIRKVNGLMHRYDDPRTKMSVGPLRAGPDRSPADRRKVNHVSVAWKCINDVLTVSPMWNKDVMKLKTKGPDGAIYALDTSNDDPFTIFQANFACSAPTFTLDQESLSHIRVDADGAAATQKSINDAWVNLDV